MLHVIAIITTHPGKREEVLQLVRANLPAVRAEDGCIAYEPTVDAADIGSMQSELGPDTFVVVERWASTQALKAHAQAPHMADYAAKTRGMIASRVIHVLSAV
ncbi:MAG TPA: putative quinol monooxygenase [Beijerinckiaceae bacterium]|jgi:quinol monooxygenase YgiN